MELYYLDEEIIAALLSESPIFVVQQIKAHQHIGSLFWFPFYRFQSFFNQCSNLLENKPLNSVLMTKYEAKEPVRFLRSRGEIIWNIYHRNICDAQLRDKQKWKKM